MAWPPDRPSNFGRPRQRVHVELHVVRDSRETSGTRVHLSDSLVVEAAGTRLKRWFAFLIAIIAGFDARRQEQFRERHESREDRC